MPNDNSTMESRFDERFNNRLGSCFECCEAETMMEDIKQFIQSEIDRAVGEREREIAETIGKNEEEIGEKLYGWDCYPGSHKQAKEIVEFITSLITKQS